MLNLPTRLSTLPSILNGKSFVRALAALLIVSMPSPDRREGISLAW